MSDIEKTIKYFESLQRRYQTSHRGVACERVSDALEALRYYRACVPLPPAGRE